MGICSSSQITRNKNISTDRAPNDLRRHRPLPPLPNSIKIISLNGTLQEFNAPIKASHVLKNPLTPRRSRDCFLCSADSMQMGEPPPPVAQDDELDPGQIYFLFPLSRSHYPMSLQDMCLLAIRASIAFGWLAEKEWLSTGDGGETGIGCGGVDGGVWTPDTSILISK